MTRKERVLRTIRRQEIDYLPSNIFFASPETKLTCQKALGLGCFLSGFLAWLVMTWKLPRVLAARP